MGEWETRSETTQFRKTERGGGEKGMGVACNAPAFAPQAGLPDEFSLRSNYRDRLLVQFFINEKSLTHRQGPVSLCSPGWTRTGDPRINSPLL